MFSTLQDRLKSDVAGVFLAPSGGFTVEATLVWGDVTRTLPVLFEENYAGFDLYGVEAGNSGPAAIADYEAIKDDDGRIPGETSDQATLTIDGTTYYVIKGARHDATVLLKLSTEEPQNA